jgi:hypothetical protein
MQKSTVEIKLMQRKNGTQYFEVWVRSAIRPELRRGSIVERDFRAKAQIPILAGAIAEGLAESFQDPKLDPSDVAQAAAEAYHELELESPDPKLGDEARIDG